MGIFPRKSGLLPLLALALALLPRPGAGAYIPRSELPLASARTLDYTIQVRLDPAERTLTGRQVVRWTNQTAVATRHIPFHLYLNAFRNNRSTFMRESRGSHRAQAMEEGEWGWIDVTRIRLADGRDLLDGARFVQPDDGNTDDRTVLEVPLPSEVPAGGSVTLEMEFLARLPHAFARTGFKGNFFMAAQWYPKPGVYQGEAGWNCHQFHSNSEFFADFARYDVAITVPQAYVVGATGRAAGPPQEHPDGTATHRYLQDDIHDFAWTADPDFLRRQRHFVAARDQDALLAAEAGRALGYPPQDLALDDVEVTLLLQPEHASQEERVFQAVFAAINAFGLWYGRYPYPTLTVVDPQHGARGAGGMEYPTLITIGSDWLAPAPLLSPESVTVHEFGHQYWYGLVASNEFEESWLDEGITTYSQGKVLEAFYGARGRGTRVAGVPLPLHPPLVSLAGEGEDRRNGRRPRPAALHLPARPWSAGSGASIRPQEWLLLHRLGLPEFELLAAFREAAPLTYLHRASAPVMEGYRADFLSGPGLDPVVRPAWEFLDRRSYRLNSYRRPALVLATLENVVGPDTMLRIMRKYHERYRYRHPTSDDFVRTAEEMAGRELGWLLQPLLHSSLILDYAVDSATCEPVPDPEGVFQEGGRRRLEGTGPRRPGQPELAGPEPPAGSEPLYHSEVVVRRVGEVAVPVSIELEFSDGATRRHSWDGQDRWTRLSTTGPQRLVRATVDPDRVYLVDVSWINNTRRVTPDPRPPARWSLRLLLWMQSVLAFYGGLA